MIHSLPTSVPPSFRVKPENFFGPIGSTVRFSCKATGSPEPHIRWLLGGYPVEHDERLVQQHSDQSDDFVIIGIKRDERGLVQCIAENEAGSIQWSAHARVRVGRKFFIQNFFRVPRYRPCDHWCVFAVVTYCFGL